MRPADHRAAIDLACRLIESSADVPTLARLAAAASLSPGHFQRVFKAALGISPRQYALAHRRQRLERSLRSAPTVTDAIYAAGYAGSSAAYRDSQALGMAPRRIRNGGEKELIRHAMAGTSLGPVLIAATGKGICMLEFGEEETLLGELRRRFPRASLERADATLAGWVNRVVAVIDDSLPDHDLPLDIRGTAFQSLVWQALRNIAPGETISYGELARRIGAPTGARAVARACASNGIAVLLPCHRVVAGDGQLTGYRWGIERKRRLLENEQAPRRRQLR